MFHLPPILSVSLKYSHAFLPNGNLICACIIKLSISRYTMIDRCKKKGLNINTDFTGHLILLLFYYG